jgi:ribosomal protein S18 acetylase RimI-like enzyme
MTTSIDDGRRLQRGIADGELDEVAAALVDAFADYPVQMGFTGDVLRSIFVEDDVVPGACRLVREDDGEMVGVGLAARRGEQGRIAAMGVTRSAARTGVGRILGEALLAAFGDAGASEVILEVLTVNEPAIALYEGLGFSRRRRLVGFDRSPGGGPITAARWDEPLADGSEPPSWQLDRVIASARGQVDLVRVPAVVPEHHPVARLLLGSGFERAPIEQFEMERPL